MQADMWWSPGRCRRRTWCAGCPSPLRRGNAEEAVSFAILLSHILAATVKVGASRCFKARAQQHSGCTKSDTVLVRAPLGLVAPLLVRCMYETCQAACVRPTRSLRMVRGGTPTAAPSNNITPAWHRRNSLSTRRLNAHAVAAAVVDEPVLARSHTRARNRI